MDYSRSGGFRRFVYGILSTLVSQSVDTLKGFGQVLEGSEGI
jgi:hypothetical protein